MGTQYLQGFEQVVPTSATLGQVLPSEFSDFYGLDLPENTSDWFINASGTQDTTSGPMITADDSRVMGQCMRIRRPDGGSFNNQRSITLSRTMVGQQGNVTVGFAFRYDKAPIVATPLLQFAFNSGESVDEQTSLWLSAQGQIFASSVDFNVNATTRITPAPVPGGATPPATINCTAWSYIEAQLITNEEVPELHVYINNRRVLSIVNSSVQKASAGPIDKVSIINPLNQYFADNSYTMFIDDIYIFDGMGDTNIAPAGPQYVAFVPADIALLTQWTVTGSMGDSAMTIGRQFDPENLTAFTTALADARGDRYLTQALPDAVAGITSVSIGAFVSIDTGSDPVDLLLQDELNEVTLATPVNNETPVYRTAIRDLTPGGNHWTKTRLRAAKVGISS